jgi:hypothetical protein
METKILDLTGNALAPAPTEAKKAHDPDELKREQQRLNGLLHQWFSEYVRDVRTPEGMAPVVLSARDAVRALYDAKWREQARIMNASGFPHQVEAFAKTVEQWEAQERADQEANTPMHQLTDAQLRKYELYPVGPTTKAGGLQLYANSAAAVEVYATGRVLVWVRPANLRIEEWAQDVHELTTGNLWPPLVDADNYPLGLLLRLYEVLRVPSVAEIPPHLVVAPPKKEQSNWWSKRNNG